MELRDGYKQTEVGLIPHSWFCRLLGGEIREMTDFVAAGSFESLRNNVVVSEAPDHAMYVRLFDLRLGLGHSRQKYVDEAGYKFLSKSNLFGNEILIANIGANVGEALLMPQSVGAATVAPNMIVIRADDRRLRYDFLYYYIKSNVGQSSMFALISGSGHPKINKTELKRLNVVVPPITEQAVIAAALSDVDALLAKIDQFIAKKRDLKQAAMQQLLTGQIRLPGFSGEWEVKRLGDVLERIVGGGTPSRSNPNYWGGDIPWVTVKDFATFDPIQAQESITYAGLKSSASNLIPKGTLITSTRMALGRAVIYEVDVTINQDLKALFPKRFLHTKFLYYWFEQNAEAIDDLGSGSTVKGISLSDLRAIPFHLASLSEQTAIATVLSDMDAELAALEARRDKTRALKQGMMQALLTGRIRLAGAD